MVRKKRFKTVIVITIFIFCFIKILLGCDLFRYCLAQHNWYVDILSERRQSTQKGYFIARGEQGLFYELGYPPTESVNRGVFVKKMGFITEPDSLMRHFNPKDTIFYIEKGYKWGKKTSKDTRILSKKETSFPFQLVAQQVSLENSKYLEFPYEKSYNESINDSIFTYFITALKKVENDTIKLKIVLRDRNSPKKVEFGFVKIF